MIRPLDPSVRAQLRSGVSVPSVAQCVEELVLNSLDAAATCIAVRIDLENFWIQVVDNGHGIPKDQLTIVGDRYATSKCHTVTDLENLNFFGFRGEALASIAQVCAVLEIESRYKVSTKVNTKVFRHGKVVSVFESKNHRPTNGTTVTVHNVFHNLPVRQKFVSASLEWERIRERVAAIALIHPGVSFTLRNENVGGKYLQTHKTSSLVACFGSLFGNKKSMSLREASHQHKQFKISGFISREGHRNKDLQFLYINSRLILRTKVHKFLNLLLSKSTVVNRRAGQWEPRTPTVRDSSAADASSPGKQRDYYGMFVLNISCPLSEYDISLDPSKTLVEFKEWETLLTCVQDMVQKFLKQENLTMSLDPNVGEHMSSLLQDEKITISKSSPGRAGTAGVDLQTVTNNSGVDYGEGISTLNSNAILHSKTVNRLSHTKLANSGDTEGQGHADNARSEPEDGTCKASAEESHHLCTSVYMDDICQEDKYQMPREDKAVPVHIDLESHASHTSAKAESKGAELTSEEQSGMDDTMDDTFDYGPAVSQGYGNEQLFTTNSLNDSFLKENDIQSLVVSSDVESSTVTSAPVPDLSSHQCQTLADSNESKLGHADDRLEEENVHCNSNESTFKNVSMAAIIPSKTFQEDAEDTRELLCASSNFHEIDSQPINPARFLGEMTELCCFSSTSEETVRNECHTRSNFQKYEHESTVHQGSTESLHSVCNQQEVNREDCGEMELDSTGLCAAEKVRNCELIGKLKDTHGNNSANWEQGLEQIVPGSHESIDLTCQPAEHGSEDVPNEYTGNSLHNRELCEDSQCAQISRTPKPVIPTRAVTSRQLSTSSPNVITATSPAGCHSKADMVRHDSMEDCRSDGLENMADMKAKTGAVEKDCTVQEKERSCEMSVGSGQKVVESHEAQEELCKIKVTDRELTNTTKQCSLEHRRSALSDGFRKVNAVWARQFDQTCGVEVYVNLMTGHTQLDCPEDDRVDVGTSSSVNVSMSAGGEKKWKGTVHPFLTHNATPFLPRAKRPCHDTDKLSTSNESDNEESVAQLWDSWENPVFSRTEKSILNVAAGTGGTARVRTVIQPYRFSREMLDSIQNSSHNFTITSAPNLLVLIDQHAAHERVRLEKLHEDLYEVDPGSPHQHLKSSHVIPPLEVPLPAEELRLLQAYKPAFQRLGLNFSTDDNKMNTAVVSSLPCCVVEREYNERKRGRLAVAVELVESLIKEKLELLKTTDGAGATLPHTLHRILNSQACHGAIKFGDPLEEADCADLIRCLSRCNLPFQCAHGRPSLIPIIDLTSPIQKEEQSQEYSRPNLGKLKHRIACEGSQSSHHKALQEDHSLLQES
ncbi:DNA mismatch repair protein [Branchiostoma belcheri]|nr:DNA mismatch repair protein [Branchiostoma belcheri]